MHQDVLIEGFILLLGNTGGKVTDGKFEMHLTASCLTGDPGGSGY